MLAPIGNYNFVKHL